VATTKAPKISQKELRQPDEFQTLGERALQHITDNRKWYILGIIALFVIAGVVSGVRAIIDHRTEKISKMYADALESFDAPIVEENEENKENKPEGLYFPTEEAKYLAALQKFESLQQSYSGSNFGYMALFYIGDCHFKLKRYDKAAEYYARFTDEGSSDLDSLKFVARHNLAQALEMQGKLDDAIKQYDEILNSSDKVWREQAYFFKGYLLEKQDKKEDAVKMYEKMIEEFPESQLKSKAEKRLMMLKG